MPPTGKLILELGGIANRRIGDGTFGGKTQGFERFAPQIEKHPNLFIPPYQSLPIEFFMPALKRAGWVRGNNEPTKKEMSIEDIKFDRHELDILRAVYESFQNRLLFVRSDEPSAKGIGLYGTNRIALDGANGFNEFIQSVKYTISSQFNADAEFFRKMKEWPFGMGIVFMQAVGEKFGDEGCGAKKVFNDRFGPIVSIAGFTLKDNNEISIRVGSGFGGGVKSDASTYKLPRGKGCFLEFPENRGSTEVYDLTKRQFDRRMSIPFLIGHELLPDKSVIMQGMINAFESLLNIAKEACTDIYFEINSSNLADGTYAITQIDEHVWNRTKKPEGRTIWRSNGFRTVVGSGVLKFKRYVCDTENEPLDIEQQIRTSRNLLLITNYAPRDIEYILRISAIIDSGTAMHLNPFSSHVHGCIREAGRIMMHGVENIGALNYALRNRNKKDIVVWADEYSDKGGIVLQ